MKGWAKGLIRGLILGVAVFFLVATVRRHGGAIASLSFADLRWSWLALGFTLTLLSHAWAGWVWAWLLAPFAPEPLSPPWAIRTYLTTTIAKYIPGNVWQFYGRIQAAQGQGVPLAGATVATLSEPLLMAAAALILALLTWPGGLRLWQIPLLITLLCTLHPRPLNWALARLSPQPLKIQAYPWGPLGGELLFVGGRSLGFLCTILALMPLRGAEIPQVISGFAVAWVLGLVLPGAPGGLGVFESVAVGLLSPQFLLPIGLFRLSNTLAEAVGAGLAWLIQWFHR